jgi:hypothetical protein
MAAEVFKCSMEASSMAARPTAFLYFSSRGLSGGRSSASTLGSTNNQGCAYLANSSSADFPVSITDETLLCANTFGVTSVNMWYDDKSRRIRAGIVVSLSWVGEYGWREGRTELVWVHPVLLHDLVNVHALPIGCRSRLKSKRGIYLPVGLLRARSRGH